MTTPSSPWPPLLTLSTSAVLSVRVVPNSSGVISFGISVNCFSQSSDTYIFVLLRELFNKS